MNGSGNLLYINILYIYIYIGAAWTNKFKPIKIEKTYENCDDFDEDKYTKIYMNKYGIENVRGGAYVQIEMDQNTIELLKKELKSSNNQCYKCGKTDHFIKQCTLKQCTLKQCTRCFRRNHIFIECYANKDINGKVIDN